MKKSLLLGMAAALIAGMSSCSNDDLLKPDRNTPLEEDQTFFCGIDIRSTESMTRAYNPLAGGSLNDDENGDYVYDPEGDPDFNRGTDQENAVKTIYLIFYDKNGDRVATTQVRKDNMTPEAGSIPSVNSLYKGVIQIDVKHGQLPPAYVMCFINPITSMNFEINPQFATLDELQKTTRPRIIDDTDYFAMSKSVYYGMDRTDPDYKEGEDNPAKYKKIIATPIPEDQLFTMYQDAKDAVDNATDKVIDIYVERYAAKVNFSVDGAENAIQPLTILAGTEDGNDNVVLKFVPEYWAVNAYENETYVCKSFLGSDLQKDMSYETMNNALGGVDAWWWNNPSLHRCYWAQTPGYYKQEYPRVADDILDKRTDTDPMGGFSLGYYSYNEMKKNATEALNAKARKVVPGTQTHIYARENTTSGAALQDAYENPMASPKAAVASAVLVGHYTIDGNEVPETQTFYVSGNAVNGYNFYKNDDDMLVWFMNTTIHFANDRLGNDSFYDYGIEDYGFTDENFKKYFKIAHPSEAVRKLDASNPAVIDSRFVTVQINEETLFADDAPTIYAEIDGVFTAITKDNVTKVNQQMFYQAGTVQGFKGGKAYFTIPIKHLGFYRKNNANEGKTGTEKNFQWDKVMSGDFGLVRNHIYSIVVNTIKGLGNGIPNWDDPIVPPTDPEEYFIGARINVLNWAVVPKQGVDL